MQAIIPNVPLVAHEYHDLIEQLFNQIAQERRKSVKRILDLFFLKENKKVTKRFWQLLDQHLPGQSYDAVWVCPETRDFTLVKEDALNNDNFMNSFWSADEPQ